jgi:hypothetical protein
MATRSTLQSRPGAPPPQAPVASTTFTARDGTPTVQEGPFADSKERLGGVFVIDVPDLIVVGRGASSGAGARRAAARRTRRTGFGGAVGLGVDRPRRGPAAPGARVWSTGPLPIQSGDPVGALQPGGRLVGAASRAPRVTSGRAVIGWRVALAAVGAETDGPAVGLQTLDAVTDPAAQRFQPARTTRAHVLAGPARRRLSAGHRPDHGRRGGQISARAAGRVAVRFAERAVDARPGRWNSQTKHARRSVMGDQTSAVAWSDAMSAANGAIVSRISAIVASGTPAADSEQVKWPASRLKWCMVIPRP